MTDTFNLLLKLNTEIDCILEICEGIHKTKCNSTNHSPYSINLFEKYQAIETDTSWSLCEIMKFKLQGENIIFREFAKKYLVPLGFNLNNIIRPIFENERWNIDISVTDKNYAIIFENKIKNAIYQRNQIGKYIARLKSFGYKDEQIFIVILPLYYNPSYIEGMRKSVWRRPSDWELPNQRRKCAHNDPYCCWCDDNTYILSEEEKKYCKEQCIDFKHIYNPRTVVLHNSFADWLLNITVDIIPSDEYILKSAVIQLGDYFKGLFQTRLNENLVMEMQEYIRKNLLNDDSTNLDNWKVINEKLSQLDELKRNMERLRNSLSQNLIEEWKANLLPNWPNLKCELNKSFGLLINGVWCGCWSGDDNNGKTYWGFWCEERPSDQQIEMVKDILEMVGVDSHYLNHEKGFIKWQNTLKGDIRCAEFYKAAKSLSYI